MKLYILIMILSVSILSVTFADTPTTCPNSHAPIGIMGDHGHESGEVMFSYRFMAMDMLGLQSGMEWLETADVLKDFMMAPTNMDMKMRMFGAMFAPHDRITLMTMGSYQQRSMEMMGAHKHATGHHDHPVGTHVMSSDGISDIKLDALLSLWSGEHLTILGNVGVSFPTGSIAQEADDGSILPYPMQLGSGSYEARPGIAFFGAHGNWSFGSQLRGTFPLHTNVSEYRHGNVVNATAWGTRGISNWISFSGRLLFSHKGNITGSHPDLNPNMSPSHRSDFRGANRLDVAFSSDLIMPTGALAGHRLAVEFIVPLYQHLTGTQLKQTWRIILGWQYAFQL